MGRCCNGQLVDIGTICRVKNPANELRTSILELRASHSVTDWSDAKPEERGMALWDLLEFVDALPVHGESPFSATPGPSLPEKVIAVHEALDVAEVSHALGGAIAFAYYGEPRATVDIDVNVFASSERWPRVRDALAPLGMNVSIDLAALHRDGEAQPEWDRNPVHLFFSRDELHDAMESATRRVPFGEATLSIVSPEHLLIRKTMLNRSKDWLDIEQILVATEPLNLPEIEEWLRRMVGDGDPRLEKLAEIKARFELSNSPDP